MSKTRWFIEQAPFTDRDNNDSNNLNSLIWAIRELGLDHHIEKYVPFGGMNYDFFQDDAPVVFYGSLNAAKDCQRQGTKWKPFIWANWNAFKCSSYYAHWGDFILMPSYGMYPLKEIPRKRDLLHSLYGRNASSNGIYSVKVDNSQLRSMQSFV